MVQVRKFSQFPSGTLDESVGLANGANTRGPGGTSSGGSVTHTFPQQAPPVDLGDWLKIELASGLYLPGQGDTAADAEIIGLCIESNLTTFTVQQAGYIESGLAIPGISGLTPGEGYFIDTATAGVMVPVDASVNGQVSRAVFLADGPDSGWVLPYRGFLVGGAAPSSGGGGTTTDSNIQVINQNLHGFIPGDVLRIDTVAVGGPVQYAKAQANSFANAQVVGVVCATPAPTANQFSLQECGYNIGSITMDDVPAAVVAKTIYYLSPTAAGKVTATNPNLIGQISRPVYACEQGSATLGVNAGWILPQRPFDLSQAVPPTHTLNGNPDGLITGQVVYIDGDSSYGLAKADNFNTAQVAGIVVQADGTSFTVQQSGWCNGVVTGVFVDTGAPVSGAVLYLSDTNAGNLTATVPSVVGRYHKPCYVQETAAGRIGEILPQKPTIITSNIGGTGLIFLGTTTVVNQPSANFDNLLDATFDDYEVVFENVGSVTNNTIFRMRVGTGAGPTYQVVNYAGVNCIFNVGAPGAQTSGTTAMDLTLAGRTTNAAFSIGGKVLISNTNSGNAKMISGQGIYRDSIGGTTPWGWTVSGQWQNAAPITSLQFLFGAGNVATGTFKLYGYQK